MTLTRDELRAGFPGAAGQHYFGSFRRGLLAAVARPAIADYLDAVERGAEPAWHAALADDCRAALARFLDAPGGAAECAFFRCTADAISAIAGAIDWRAGDEVVISDREYPANVFPWMRLADRGVSLRIVASRDERVPLDAYTAAIGPRTRVVATSSTFFTSGFVPDAAALAAHCRARGVVLLLDAVQTLATRPYSCATLGAGVVVGDARKFLGGIDGAAFAWIRADLVPSLSPQAVGAMSMTQPRAFSDWRYELRSGASRFEPGAHAGASLAALRACLAWWSHADFAEVERWIADDVAALRAGLAGVPGVWLPDFAPHEQGAIVLTRIAPAHAPRLRRLAAAARVSLAVRDDGELGLAPHVFTTRADIDAAVATIAAATTT